MPQSPMGVGMAERDFNRCKIGSAAAIRMTIGEREGTKFY